MLLLSRDEHRAGCIRVILSTLCEQCSSAAALHCKRWAVAPTHFFFVSDFSRIKKKERCCLMNAEAKNCKNRGRHRCAGAQKMTPARGIRTGERGVVAPVPNFYAKRQKNIYTKLSMYMERVFCCCSRHNPHTCCWQCTTNF